MTSYENEIKAATARFEATLRSQLERSLKLEQSEQTVQQNERPIKIGILPGDDELPAVMEAAEAVLRTLLLKQIQDGAVEIIRIEGLHMQGRLTTGKAVPTELLAKIKDCRLILKGAWRNPDACGLESVDAVLRKELDLYAHIRPVLNQSEGTEWVLFQEIAEGERLLGAHGLEVQDLLSIDFKVTTAAGALRFARAAFAYAKIRGFSKMAVAVKDYEIKKTDGCFARAFHTAAGEYDGIEVAFWDPGRLAAGLQDPEIGRQMQILVMPDLYGGIIIDEVEQLQCKALCAGYAQVGDGTSLFGAVSRQRMAWVNHERGKAVEFYGMMQAVQLLLDAAGYHHLADQLLDALRICETKAQKNQEGSVDIVQYIDCLLQSIEEM